MSLADFKIVLELLVYFSDLIILGDNQIDLRASLAHECLKASCIVSCLLPLLAKLLQFFFLG
jgi:hypothetical protein